jgi:putative Holliday junction resolvase
VGIAVSDSAGVLATPLRTVTRRGAPNDYLLIAAIVHEERAERVVVGLPQTLAGAIGPQARRVQRWAERLRPHLAVPLVYWDERYSTAEAERRLSELPARRRPPLDAVAAAVILQDFLDADR